MKEIKGKRPAPNGMYWGNVVINGKYKLVMVEPVSDNVYRAWSNKKSLEKEAPMWTKSEKRKGWFFCDMAKDEFIIFDW